MSDPASECRSNEFAEHTGSVDCYLCVCLLDKGHDGDCICDNCGTHFEPGQTPADCGCCDVLGNPMEGKR